MLTNLANVGQIVDSQGRTVTIQSADGTIYVQGTSDDGHREQLHHADRHHRCFHRGQLEQLRRRLITASFRSRVSAAAKRIQRFI